MKQATRLWECNLGYCLLQDSSRLMTGHNFRDRSHCRKVCLVHGVMLYNPQIFRSRSDGRASRTEDATTEGDKRAARASKSRARMAYKCQALIGRCAFSSSRVASEFNPYHWDSPPQHKVLLNRRCLQSNATPAQHLYLRQSRCPPLNPSSTMASLRSSAPAAIFRLAAQPGCATRCARCVKAQRCPFSSFRPRQASQGSKRPLMTESAYRTQSLESDLPLAPPRNAGVPETSIAGGGQTREGAWPSKASVAGEASVREGEAQKSKPVSTTSHPPAAPVPSPTTPKKSKLRPRKAALKLSPTAVEHLRQLHEQPEGKFIRVGVKNRGCSGLAYHLEYVNKPGAFDEAVEQDGVKVLIDSKALFSIIGSEMDWAEDKLAARFVFRNPNISKYITDPIVATHALLKVGQRNSADVASHSVYPEDPDFSLVFLSICHSEAQHSSALHRE